MIKNYSKSALPSIRPDPFLYSSCTWLSSTDPHHFWLIKCPASNFTAKSLKWCNYALIWLQSIKIWILKRLNRFLSSYQCLTKSWVMWVNWNITFHFFGSNFFKKNSHFWRELKNMSICGTFDRFILLKYVKFYGLRTIVSYKKFVINEVFKSIHFSDRYPFCFFRPYVFRACSISSNDYSNFFLHIQYSLHISITPVYALCMVQEHDSEC